jgi:hypothetical protein
MIPRSNILAEKSSPLPPASSGWLLGAGLGSVTRADRPAYTPMTPDERERMLTLCERIAPEQDSQEFTELVLHLSDLLDAKDCRLVTNKEDSK